jgi:hypothetical protein
VPAGTIRTGSSRRVPERAACSAVKVPSAMPTRTSSMPSAAIAPASTVAAAASPPK